MSRSVAALRILVQAGTKEFHVDMDKINAKVVDFGNKANAAGNHAASGIQGASAAIRIAEGNLTNNVRAVERFLANVLGLGPALQAIFPVLGAIAFAGVLVKLGEETKKFFTTIRDAPEKARAGFDAITQSTRVTNDGLRVTGDLLQNEINKLEGKRQNTLKLELDLAREAADNLAKALDKDIEKLNQLLKENETGLMERLFGAASDKGLREELGGKTGTGGFTGERRAIERNYQEQIAAEKDKTKQAALRAALDAALHTADMQMVKELERQKAILVEESKAKTIEVTKHFEIGGDEVQKVVVPGANNQKILEEYKGAIDALKEQDQFIDLQGDVTNKEGRKRSDEANRANAESDRPLDNKLKELDAAIAGAKLKLNAAGLSEVEKVIANAQGNALKAIEEVNKALTHQSQLSKGISPADEQKIKSRELTLAQTESEEKWKNKLAETTAKITDETRAQNLLTAAIGRGYEAVKQAAVETAVMKEVTPQRYEDFLKSGANAADVMRVRAAAEAAYEAKHRAELAQTADSLKDQIGLERLLSQTQAQGMAVVQLATLQYNLALLAEKGATKEVLDAEVALFAARRENDAAKEITKINQQIEALDRLAAATAKGAEAARQAALESKYVAIQRKGDISIPGVLGIGAEELAQRTADWKAHQLEIEKSVSGQVNGYGDALAKLDAEKKYLLENKDLYQSTADVVRVLRDLEDERLKLLVKQTLEQRTALDGVRAFFLEMQEQAKSTASIIYEAMNRGLDGVAANLAKLMTGQRTEWSKMLKGLGESMVQESVKSSLQTGIGGLGKALGIKLPTSLTGKVDGSSAERALWVRLAGAANLGTGAGTGGTGTIFGNGGILGTGNVPTAGAPNGSQSSGGFWGNLLHLLIPGLSTGKSPGGGGSVADMNDWGGFMADGGSVSPGMTYMVGESGPEMFSPSSHGSIVPNGKMGGDTHNWHIDARGSTDPVATRSQVEAGIRAAHASAISSSVRANHDMARRTPRTA